MVTPPVPAFARVAEEGALLMAEGHDGRAVHVEHRMGSAAQWCQPDPRDEVLKGAHAAVGHAGERQREDLADRPPRQP